MHLTLTLLAFVVKTPLQHRERGVVIDTLWHLLRQQMGEVPTLRWNILPPTSLYWTRLICMLSKWQRWGSIFLWMCAPVLSSSHGGKMSNFPTKCRISICSAATCSFQFLRFDRMVVLKSTTKTTVVVVVLQAYLDFVDCCSIVYANVSSLVLAAT